MDQEGPTSDPYDGDAVIFIAEGLLCETLNLQMNEAVVALAGMAVERGIGLLELAREIAAQAPGPGSLSEARRPAKDHEPDPDS